MERNEDPDTDDAGAPRIRRTSAKISALERRQDYLEGQIEEAKDTRSASLSYDKAEYSALIAAVLCMKYHRADVEGLDMPILALQALTDANGMAFGQGRSVALKDAWKRVKEVLDEWG